MLTRLPRAAATLAALTALAACVDAPLPAAPTALPLTAAVTADDAVPNEYLVTLRSGRDVRAAAHRARAAGATVLAEWEHALRGFAMRAAPEAVTAISRDRDVAQVTANTYVHALGVQNCTPYTTCSWGLDRIDETNLPMDGNYVSPPRTGIAVHAYILDTGLRITHTEFGSRASYGWDFIDNDATASDCNGHGTSVGGIVGGANFGVAKGVQLVAVRVLNCSGSGSTAQVISGINWVTANAIRPAVVNLSLGSSANATLDSAVSNSIASGLSYAVAAGASMSDACNFSPARVLTAITVASTGDGGGLPPANPDRRSSFSNFGTCIDLFAPGSSIKTAWHTSDVATNTLSGTSYASAFVTGASALYLDYFPTRTPAQVSTALANNASVGVVQNPGVGTPNLLLNIGVPHRP